MIMLSAIENDEARLKAERIYRSYGKFMLHIASKYLPEDKRADALQEAMIRIINRIGNIDDSDELRCRCYCGTVIRHVSIDMLRADKKYLSLDDVEESTDSVSAEDETMIRYDAECAVNAILSLNDTYRSVCYLKYVNGLKEREIAEALGLSEKVVSLRIFRGKQIIRKELTETNGRNRIL